MADRTVVIVYAVVQVLSKVYLQVVRVGGLRGTIAEIGTARVAGTLSVLIIATDTRRVPGVYETVKLLSGVNRIGVLLISTVLYLLTIYC